MREMLRWGSIPVTVLDVGVLSLDQDPWVPIDIGIVQITPGEDGPKTTSYGRTFRPTDDEEVIIHNEPELTGYETDALLAAPLLEKELPGVRMITELSASEGTSALIVYNAEYTFKALKLLGFEPPPGKPVLDLLPWIYYWRQSATKNWLNLAHVVERFGYPTKRDPKYPTSLQHAGYIAWLYHRYTVWLPHHRISFERRQNTYRGDWNARLQRIKQETENG